jgi:1,4-dihydroxy-2-naphthoate polyprenyltransferase
MPADADARPLPTGWRVWLLGARPRTLPAAVAPVLVGTAAAGGVAGLRWWVFLCALGVAVFVQVATNYANDYSDGKRGTDDPGARVGPPRLVGNGLASPAAVKRATIITFGLTVVCGMPLVLFVDWWLALVGVAAVAAGWFYTGGSRPYGYAGYGELFVFVFFGLVATVGSYYVQVRSIGWVPEVAGVAMGCLATALLVVNNLRDIPGDTRAGKHTLAVRLGDQRTRILYIGLLVVPFVLLPLLAGGSGRPLAALAFVAVVLARRPVAAVLGGALGPDLIPVLADTGRVQLVYGVLLAAGLFLGG